MRKSKGKGERRINEGSLSEGKEGGKKRKRKELLKLKEKEGKGRTSEDIEKAI